MRRYTFLFLSLLALAAPAAAQDAFEGPEWARHAVWYQIFPERFRNGDPSNDPRLEDTRGSWPHDHTSAWQVHPWTSDWYALQPYEKTNGKDVWHNLQRRRYGGDLQGILDQLDYLEELGITAIYLNPIFAAPSQHKYDAYLYHHVDPTFGPDPEGDRKLIASEDIDDPSTWKWTAADKLAVKLIQECHKRNIRVIFDGVFNHIGMASPFFRDVVERRDASPYRDWFIIKSFDPLEYQGWFGIKELPEWREENGTLVKGPKEYVFAATRRWMDQGIDGWRLDVAFCVGHPFWKEWSAYVRQLNPEAYLTAEVIDTVEANKPFLEGDEFSAVMNYNFAFITSEYFLETKRKLTASQFDAKLRALREAYPAPVAGLMQNLFCSHDTARLASNIVNRHQVTYGDWPRYCEISKGSHPLWSPRGPNAEEKRLQKLMAIFQMTYVGAPMLYYGDETGMWGANDPDCRKPMIWEDLSYEPERKNPDQSERAPDPVAFDPDLFEHYRTLIQIRKAHKALRTGGFETVLADDEKDLYAFARTDESERIVVVINNSDQPRTYQDGKRYRDLLGNGQTIPPRWGAILLEQP